ncbi:MAG: sensor histidine kinase [Spirochaetota bacterium]
MADDHGDLQHRYHRLEEEYRRFVHGVSHYLKAPITALIGYASLLAKQGPESPEWDQYLQRIVDNSRLLDSMIEELLLVSRLGEPSPGPCSLDHAVHEALRPLHRQLEDREIRLWVQPGTPPVCMSEQHLVQLCSRVLGNAVRYSPPGGRVSVGFLDGEYYVSDRGPGMSEEVRGRAFDMFFTTEKKGLEHTGAGLFIAARIARLYGGEIRLESSPGNGATVLFRIPHRTPRTA